MSLVVRQGLRLFIHSRDILAYLTMAGKIWIAFSRKHILRDAPKESNEQAHQTDCKDQ